DAAERAGRLHQDLIQREERPPRRKREHGSPSERRAKPAERPGAAEPLVDVAEHQRPSTRRPCLDRAQEARRLLAALAATEPEVRDQDAPWVFVDADVDV